MPIESYCYNQDFLSEYSELLLVDIIPPFLTPKIFKFDLDELQTLKPIVEAFLFP
jgi:hypothetical protein